MKLDDADTLALNMPVGVSAADSQQKALVFVLDTMNAKLHSSNPTKEADAAKVLHLSMPHSHRAQEAATQSVLRNVRRFSLKKSNGLHNSCVRTILLWPIIISQL
jgi:hypothetical protein